MDSSKIIERYLKKMQKIQSALLEIINENKENDIQDLIIFLDKIKICDNHDEFKSFLHLLSILYETHHQRQENMTVIEKIIIHYKDYIEKNFQNCEIFSLFQNDLKLLLFLIQSGIIKIDKAVHKWLEEDKYKYFFYQEIKDKLRPDIKKAILNKIPDDYIFKRDKGENDSYLCEIIRKDSIEDFISYVSKTGISLNTEIKESLFETNTFLKGKTPTLIEYSAFYGSMQIFKYLQLNKVSLTESIWPYAIHNQNSEIISILEDKNIKPDSYKAIKYYKRAIKCHHNDIANYIQENYIDGVKNINEEEENKISNSSFYFKYYNFEYITPELIDKSIFIDLCSFDYPIFVDILLKTEEIDINSMKTKKQINSYYKNSFYSTEKSALSAAVNNNNTEIAKILLTKDDIDVNYKYKCLLSISIDYLKQSLNTIAIFITCGIFMIISKILGFINLIPDDMLYSIPFLTFGIVLLILLILKTFRNALDTPISIQVFSKIKSISLSSIELIYDEMTVLHLACFNNNAEIVKILMTKQNIDVNAELKYIFGEKSNALILGISNEKIVKCLLSNPNIDVNMKFKRKYPRQMNSKLLSLFATVLLFCCPVIQLFFILFIIFSLFDKFKQLSLINQIYVGLGVIVSILINIYVQFSFINIFLTIIEYYLSFIYSKLYMIIEYSLLFYIITELISSLFNSMIFEVSPLIEAIRHNYTESAKLLLSNDKIDVNSLYKLRINDQLGFNNQNDDFDDEEDDDDLNNLLSLKLTKDKYITKTALNIAAKKGNTEIVELLLLNNKIDVEAKYKSTTYYRKINLNTTWIGLSIIGSIATLTSSFIEKSSLIIAAENSNVDVVKQLLEKCSIKKVKYDYEKLKKDKINKNNEQKSKNDKDKDDKKFNEILELLQNFINGSIKL